VRGNYWVNKAREQNIPPVEGGAPLPRGGVDVAIIGGGAAGACLYNALEHTNVSACLVETSLDVGCGATGRGAGIITWNNELATSEETRRFSLQNNRMLRSAINNLNFDCDFAGNGHIYMTEYHKHAEFMVSDNSLILHQEGETMVIANADEMLSAVSSDKFGGGVILPSAYTVNPYKLAHALTLIEKSPARRVLTDAHVESVNKSGNNFKVKIRDRGTITARKVVYCTGARTKDFVPELDGFLNLSVMHSVATKPLNDKYYYAFPPHSMSNGHRWFRLSNGRMIMGDSREFNDDFEESSELSFRKTQSVLYDTFPLIESEVEFGWSGLTCIAKDNIPLIGEIPNRTNEFVFTGLGSNPFCFAFLGGIVMADHLISGHTKIENAEIFSLKGRIK